jgi:nucleoside-diphosphate-sugar epimerase
MRVFVAGATGVAGRRTVRRLVAAGHEVTGVARSDEKATMLEALGATPVRVSLFEPESLGRAMAGHDAVVNLATKIPPLRRMASARAWDENERIRREASAHLVDAAIAAGVGVFVQESLAFLYGEHGDEWLDAESTRWAPSMFTEAMETAERHVARFTGHGGRGVVLRFGRFYAPDSDQVDAMVHAARRGIALDLGAANGYVPVIDADDVATAVVAALDAPAGVYDVVDDVPLTRGEQGRALATAVGRRRLRRAPAWIAPKRASHLSASQRVSNRRFREATGWRPASPSVREGFAKLVSEMRVEPALPGAVRLALWVLVVSAVSVGLQAAFAPQSFYDDFPFGRGWVAVDPPYNEHLVRDVGALNLALALLTAGALWLATRAVARVTAGAWLLYGVPHLVFHVRHLPTELSGIENVALAGSLAVTVVAPLAVLVYTQRRVRRDL